MTTITPMAPPTGASADYQFFKNDITNRNWKASIVVRVARPVMLDQADIEAAPAELAVSVTVSPIDNVGSALIEDGKPIIIEPFTHTFTAAEMAEASFDPQQRIVDIVASRIEAGETRLTGHNKLNQFVTDWETKAKLTVKGTAK